ncbi:MAG: leucine-rich repeat domain-containing protein [Promethearchaeota archaeon]|jgi:Leucine-rich repeat (LRR) protein
MNNLNPAAIFNDFRSGKIDKSMMSDKFFSILQHSNDDEVKIQVIEFVTKNFLDEGVDILKWVIKNVKSPNCLFTLYSLLEANLSEEAKQLRQYMEINIGRGFLDKYDLIPKEAMALELLGRSIVWNQIISREIEYNITAPDWPIYYKIKKGYVKQINIDYKIFHESEIDSKCLKLFSGLKKLCLWECNLNNFSTLTDLISLKINGGEQPQINDISEIKGLEKLTKLQELDLSHNGIYEIKNLENLVNLRKLDFSYNDIRKIKCLETLTLLESLKLGFNDIDEIIGISKLLNLRQLDLSNEAYAYVKRLPYNPGNANLRLTRIREEIEEHRNLRIKTRYTPFRHFIKEIKGLSNLVNLEELDLSGNQISEIKGLSKIKNLKILNLSNNEICEIKCIESLRNLEELYLSDTYIPKAELNEFKKTIKFKVY